MERDGKVRIVPFSDAAVMELVPGLVFYVSGGNQPELFIRIIEASGGVVSYEVLNPENRITTFATSPSEFQERFAGAMLKYKGIVPDKEWQAFSEFLDWILRYDLDRSQVWKLFSFFQDMGIEREAAELARRRE